MDDADIIIAGGGPAGATAAIALAGAGRTALLIERNPEPRETVCGEFLGPDATEFLARLDLHPASLGAVPINRLRLAHGSRHADLRLPFTGWGLPRARLDPALRDRATAAGAQLLPASIRAAERVDGTWQLRLADGTLQARHLVVATGKHNLRGAPRPHGQATGLKLHLRLATPIEGTVLIAGIGFYAGLQAGPDNTANLCAAFRTTPPRDATDFIARIAGAADLAGTLLSGAVPLWPRALAIAGVPYGWMHRGEDGPFRLGDAFAVVPSFCGDGMAMALAAGLALPDFLDAGAGPFHRHMRRTLAAPMRWATIPAALLQRMPALVVGAAAALPASARMVAAAARVRTSSVTK